MVWVWLLFWGAVFSALLFDGETGVWPWLLTSLLCVRDLIELIARKSASKRFNKSMDELERKYGLADGPDRRAAEEGRL